MGVLGMRAGGEFHFLVGALERDVEPSEEGVHVWIQVVSTLLWWDGRCRSYNRFVYRLERRVHRRSGLPSSR